MAALPKLDSDTRPEKAPGSYLDEPTQAASPRVASGGVRLGRNWIWWGLLATFALVLGMAIVRAAGRKDDTGTRGPAELIKLRRTPPGTPAR